MLPPSPPPAVVDGCNLVRHDGSHTVTTNVLATAIGAVVPFPAGAIGGAVAEGAGAALSWTELQAALENGSTQTIVGVRLGVKLGDGGFKYVDVPVTIAPGGDATASQRIASGDASVEVTSCSLLRVSFSDGTAWSAAAQAPAATPAPHR